MTDDPIDNRLDELYKLLGFNKTDATNMEKVTSIVGNVISNLVKQMTDTQLWKDGMYYLKCGAGLGVALAGLNIAVATGTYPLIVDGAKFMIKSTA